MEVREGLIREILRNFSELRTECFESACEKDSEDKIVMGNEEPFASMHTQCTNIITKIMEESGIDVIDMTSSGIKKEIEA